MHTHRDRRHATTSRRWRAAARAAGLEYIAITDHSQALAMANGLDERRALEHAARIRALERARSTASRCSPASSATSAPTARSISPTTASPQLDFVVASVHSAFDQERAADDRAAAARDRVPVGRHRSATRPGRMLLQREPLHASTSTRWSTPRRGTAWRSRSTARSTGWTSTTSTRGWRASAACRSSSRATRTRAHALRDAALGRHWWRAAPGCTPADVLNTRPFDALRGARCGATAAAP